MMTKRILISLLVLVLLAAGAFVSLRFLRNSPEASLKRAHEYFAQEQFEEARIEYMNALRADPSNDEALRQIAYTWYEQGASLSALKLLHASVEATPDNIKAQQRLGETWLVLEQTGAARKRALEVLKLDPDHGEAIVLLAKTSFGEEAVTEVEKHLEPFELEKSAPAQLAKGVIAQRRGDLEGFRSAIEAALTINPKWAQAYLALSAYYHLTNEPDKKGGALKTAAELSGARTGIPQFYAAHLAQVGELPAAVAMLEELRKAAPDYFPTLVQLAELKRLEKQYPEALKLLARVLGSDPGNPSASQTKARVYLDQGQTDEAITSLEQLDARAQLPGTKYQLARLYLVRDEIPAARTKLSEALAMNPNYVDATLLLARLELGSGGGEQAAGRLEALLKRQPGLIQAEILLAGAYQQQKRFEEVSAIFRRQTEINPENSTAHFALGRALRQENKPEAARTSILEAHRLQPENMSYVAELVGLDTLSGNFEVAHQWVRPLLETDKTGGAYFLEGRIFVAESKWEEARTALLKALDRNPGSLTAYSLLVGTYLAEQKPEEAIEELESLLEANPASLQHRMLLALLHEQGGANEQAAGAYEKLLEQSPDFLPALNNLAYLHATKLGQLERAEELALRAYELNRDDPSINDTLGWIYYQRGRFAEALPPIERAADQMPDNVEIQYHLGMARLRMGQMDGARQALEIAAAAPQKFPGQEIVRQELARLDDPTAGQEGKSIAELEADVLKAPNDAGAHLQLGLLREAEGLAPKALEAFERAAQINPKLIGAWLGLTRLHGGPLDDLDRAIQTGRKARLLDGDDPSIAALLGRLALRRAAKGDIEWSSGLLWQAAQDLETSAVQWDQAWATYLLGDLPKAQSLLEPLLAAHPDSPEASEARSFLALTQPGPEGWSSLVPAAEERLKASPEDIPALMVLARVKPAEAVGIYEGLLERIPDFVRVKIRLAGVVVRDPAQTARAEALVREVLVSLPGDPELSAVRGAVAFRGGDHQAAIQLLEKSKTALPLDADGLFFLGMAYLDAKQTDAGIAALGAALKAGLAPALREEAEGIVGTTP